MFVSVAILWNTTLNLLGAFVTAIAWQLHLDLHVQMLSFIVTSGEFVFCLFLLCFVKVDLENIVRFEFSLIVCSVSGFFLIFKFIRGKQQRT